MPNKADVFGMMYGAAEATKQPSEPIPTFPECVLRSYPTGSRYICNPAPTDTDNDTVFLVNGYYDYTTVLLNDGWEQCGNYEFAGRFNAFRKGEENYIIIEDEKFFERYLMATEAAKALNLLNKEDRIKVFQAVADAPEGVVGFVASFEKKNIPVPDHVFDPFRVVFADVAAQPANFLGNHWEIVR